MTTNVLFMCPHSAGKSLLAASYFRAAAGRAELDVAIDVAGPDPDDHNMPPVVGALEKQGFSIGWNPKLVGQAETEWADVIISLGCDAALIPTDKEMVVWNVAMPSKDLVGCMGDIHRNAEELAVELAGR